MKIYRYVPDGRQSRPMMVTYTCRFWPEGIVLGGDAEREFPKGFGSGWWLDGSRYRARETTLPLGDFVATAMNLLTVSEPAAQLFDASVQRIAVTTDDRPSWTLQLPTLEGAIDPSRSAGLTVETHPLFWNRTEFRPDRVTADVFWLQEAMPFSYVYMTERFVERATERGLTGLAHIELIWDGTSAVELQYPPVAQAGRQMGYRFSLEESFVLARGSMFGLMSEEIHPALEDAMANGRFPVDYPNTASSSEIRPLA